MRQGRGGNLVRRRAERRQKMRARSQASGLLFAKYRDVESVDREMLQPGFDSTQSTCRIAGEDCRIVQTIQKSDDEDLAGLQIALNAAEAGPDFIHRFDDGL